MANYLVKDFKDDIEDRIDNAVVSERIKEAIRQKIESVNRLYLAMSQAYYEFVRQSESVILSQIVQRVTLVADPETPDKNGLRTYLWPIEAYSERDEDFGLISIGLNGYDRLPREYSSLESVRMQARSGLYGPGQEVVAIDEAQKRIYIPNDVTATAKIIRIPQRILLPDEGFFQVTDYTNFVNPTTIRLTVGESVPVDTTFVPSTSNAESARLIKNAINSAFSGKAQAINGKDGDDTKVYFKSLTNDEITIELVGADTAVAQKTRTSNATGSYELPIHQVRGEALCQIALRNLIAVGNSDIGLESAMATAQQADQPSKTI